MADLIIGASILLYCGYVLNRHHRERKLAARMGKILGCSGCASCSCKSCKSQVFASNKD